MAPQNLEGLYCEEESWEDDEGLEEERENFEEQSGLAFSPLPLTVSEHDLFWEEDELSSLLSKEQQRTHLIHSILKSDASLMASRREAVQWVLRVNAHYSFSALTTVLAVDYLDRFISSLHFQRDKAWMGQLAAVACLSLAAKVEETKVPLLLDLQVEESRYVFEARTIQRMEILVLSSLQWKMNPVTPFSFIDHIIRRLGLKTNFPWEFLWRCERVLLSIICDSRYVCYLPSELATATMLLVIKEAELSDPIEYQNQLMDILTINKEKVDDCYQFILEILGSPNQTQKRKQRHSTPSSPNAVFDGYFSSDCSNDSWSFTEPLFKRSRAQDQQMKLPPLNRVSIDVLSNHY